MKARVAFALLLVAGTAWALASGIAGGLARTGIVVAQREWIGQAAVFHAALMICGFFGTVIGVERAVATKRRAAWLAPVCSAAGAFGLVPGYAAVGAVLLVASSCVFLAVNVMLWRRERAAHTLLLSCAAGAWLAGNFVFAFAPASGADPIRWWFAFLVATIAAERLEMMRLMRKCRHASWLMALAMGALAFGAAASNALFGIALFALALWLGVFDIARRTVRAQGLTRFMAVCLLAGYVWLAIGGIAWFAGVRDVALHALGLGFIVSMVMAHAPVILPAVTGIKVRYGAFFYAPLAILHASLVWRFAVSRGEGAIGNAAALAVFALTMAVSALQKRQSRPKAA